MNVLAPPDKILKSSFSPMSTSYHASRRDSNASFDPISSFNSCDATTSALVSTTTSETASSSCLLPPDYADDNGSGCCDDDRSTHLYRTSGTAYHDTKRSQDKKRRRGKIEKRRRDRMNQCLSELRRLVPSAFEKQGSQKLEKAEILQLTVEYLKFIHASQAGLVDGCNNGEQLFITSTNGGDYHSMGFRECASEVDRFLGAEQVDIQSPFRTKLMNHLQCASIQQQPHSYNNTATHSFPASPADIASGIRRASYPPVSLCPSTVFRPIT